MALLQQQPPFDPDELLEDGEDLTPGEQRQFDEGRRNIDMMLVADEQAFNALLESIAKAEDKKDAMATTIIAMGEKLDELSDRSLSREVMMALSIYALGRLGDLVENAGIAWFTDQDMGEILAMVIDKWFRNHPEDFEAPDNQQEFERIVQHPAARHLLPQAFEGGGDGGS